MSCMYLYTVFQYFLLMNPLGSCFPSPTVGGQAKTLMFVQLNPDVESYSETVSTLKFAERVSGVELGAARSNKDGRDVRELMEQV